MTFGFLLFGFSKSLQKFTFVIDFAVMTIHQIYNLAIEMGIAADPRGKRGVEKWLELEKKKYRQLSSEDKEFFDKERLSNPYSDTRLHFGDPDQKVKTILAGIEAEEAEIALAKTLNLKPDLIITHHPIGRSLAAIDQVMNMQVDMLAALGIPINVAEGIFKVRLATVNRSVNPANHMRAVDAAKLANIPIINLHTACDNLINQFVQKILSRKKPETLAEVISILKKIPEYKEATINSFGPKIFAGSPENRVGKIAVLTTGGTEGPKEAYTELAKAGIGTVIDMHIKEEYREEAEKHHLNVIIAGHMSSDSIGMNLFLDKLAAKGIKIIPTSGLIRVKRTSK